VNAREIIDALGLSPHPEGGFFAETWRSDETVPAGALPPRYVGARTLGTAICFLVTADSFSAMHRLLSDEVYHVYAGDPVEMLILGPGEGGRTVVLGPGLAAGMRPQAVVPRGAWQGCRVRPGGTFALLGTTVAPGFDIRDFELGKRESLVRLYPAFGEMIEALTRA
jgi:predicted cupin superfamily sugar epimerase